MIEQTANKRPTHQIVAAIPHGEGSDPLYQPIGVGWESEQGTIWLSLAFVPTDLNTSIGIRPILSSEAEG